MAWQQAAEAGAEQPQPNYAWRRGIFLALTLVTSLVAVATLTLVLGGHGLTWLELGMIGAFVLTLQFNVIGFWNAIIGSLILLGSRDPVRTLMPLARERAKPAPLAGETAIIMPVYNEDVQTVFRNLKAVAASLSEGSQLDKFDFWLLSDTKKPEVIEAENRAVADWQFDFRDGPTIHYRHRPDNTDHKAGNIWSFVEDQGRDYDYMLVLDADSVMSGSTIEWLVRIMDADPKIGILQTLTSGLPTTSLFARVLQFGMRHVMRAFTIGSAWWQGPNGSYWGHNALIRMSAFRECCKLPELSEGGPLGGRILSHDQVESAFIQAAGYEVRVLPEECESFEDTPPSLSDYIRRDLRWCQGNMQYFQLLRWPGLRTMGRVQLLLAMMNYLTAPCWMVFVVLGLTQAVLASAGMAPGSMIGFVGMDAQGAFGIDIGTAGLALIGAVLTMNFAPKLVGFFAVMFHAPSRRSYGGGARLALSMAVEFTMSLMLAPIIAVAQAVFLFRLFVLKRVIIWDAQPRGQNEIALGRAFLQMSPQLVFGTTITLVLAFAAPNILPWLSPIIVGCVLAAPLTWFTSLEIIGRWAERWQICTIPEEQMHVNVLAHAGYATGSAFLGDGGEPVLQPEAAPSS